MKRLSLKRKNTASSDNCLFQQASGEKSVDTRNSKEIGGRKSIRSHNNSCTEKTEPPPQKITKEKHLKIVAAPLINLTKFPPFTEHVVQKEDDKKPVKGAKLSPFPPMCSLCRKRKPVSQDFMKNIVMQQILDEPKTLSSRSEPNTVVRQKQEDNIFSLQKIDKEPHNQQEERLVCPEKIDKEPFSQQENRLLCPQKIDKEPHSQQEERLFCPQKTSKEPPSQHAVSQCPMCGKSFGPSFTMLDVDSHLANCLSAADDDVQW